MVRTYTRKLLKNEIYFYKLIKNIINILKMIRIGNKKYKQTKTD